MSTTSSRPLRSLRYFFHKLRLPKDAENVQVTINNIKSGAFLTGANLWVLVGAIFIASLGLNTNSTAVIIGAMLISPLMGPIMGFGLGLGTNDFALVKKALKNFIVMVVISVTTSTLFFLISPVKEAGSELLGRTSPTVYDVLIAFFGGITGIIAGASKLRRGNVIPGVAIATALMPPLCTMGYGIGHFHWQYAVGAFYLFMINSVFIALATFFIVNILRYPKVEETDLKRKKRLQYIIPLTIALMVTPSIYITYHIVKKYFYVENADKFVNTEIKDNDHIIVTSKMNYSAGNSKLEVVVVGETLDSLDIVKLNEKMINYGLKKCKLVIYQGPDSRNAIKGVFDELNTDIKLTRTSINELYQVIDSLGRKVNKAVIADSLQRSIALEVARIDSSLYHLSLQRSFSFNPSLNKNDTSWQVHASFKELLAEEKKSVLVDWLKRRLNSNDITLIEERVN